MHYSTFSQPEGQAEFRERLNALLESYESGFEISATGEILALPEKGLETLLEAAVPASDKERVASRVDAAMTKFRRHRSSLEDRRDAVRDLADVLEFLRPKVKVVLSGKDEDDLFNLANNFGVRHNNERQKTNYDKAIWYSWMFYHYLSTIHACLRLIDKAEGRPPSKVSAIKSSTK
jgi:hypothetical protein